MDKVKTETKKTGFIQRAEDLYKELDDVIKEEDEVLRNRRKAISDKDHSETLETTKIGIAFSGGGIRSASICLGAVKALSEKGVLQKADYISSVSGGGYANAYVQATLHNDKKLLTPKFLKEMQEGGADYMSARSKLIPSKLVSLLNIIGTILIGLLNPIILISTIILVWFIATSFLIDIFPSYEGSDIRSYLVRFINPLILLAVSGMIGYYFLGSTFRLRTFQLINIIIIYLLGLLFIALVLSYAGEMFAYFEAWIDNFKRMSTEWIDNITNKGFSAGRIWLVLKILALFYLVTTLLGHWIIDKLSGKKESSESRIYKWLVKFQSYKLINNIAFVLIGIVLIILFLGANPEIKNEWFALRLLGLLVLFGFFTDINLISVGRIYGDSLTRAFNFDKSIRLKELSNIDDNGSNAPYPLFNCCLNLAPQSGAPNLTADYYLLSPLYMGSITTGYADTGGITLSRAMTTSAAAVNTGMGTFSNSIASIFIGLLNLRMGSLLSNPRKYKYIIDLLKGLGSRGIWHQLKTYIELVYMLFLSNKVWWPRYYLKSLFSSNSREDTLLDISDGGHIENLAVFELLRRNCKLIIGIDAGMDANYKFNDLKNLIKRANNVLDIEINFRKGYNPFTDIKPDPESYGASKIRYGIADILKYKRSSDGKIEEDSDGNKITEPIGTFVYIKSSLSQDLSLFPEKAKKKEGEDESTIEYKAYKYKKFNSDFPHHSTADQSFEPIQFQAYYELGQSLCQDVFDDLKEPLEKSFTRKQIIDKF